jgi:hypothetical protein
MVDVDSMEYYTKLENMKRMVNELLIEGHVDPNLLTEEDMMVVLGYFDDVCQQVKGIEDPEIIIQYLMKVIVVNSALVVIKAKEVKELKDE